MASNESVDQQQTEAQVSFDVDGVVLIGLPSMIRNYTYQRFYIRNPKQQRVTISNISNDEATIRKYQNILSIRFGTHGGLSLFLITNATYNYILPILYDSITSAAEKGPAENLYLTSSGSVSDILKRSNKNFVHINQAIIDEFRIQLRHKENNKEPHEQHLWVEFAAMDFGMKSDIGDMLQILQLCYKPRYIQHTRIDYGINFKSGKNVVLLFPGLARGHRRIDGYQYPALGMKDAYNIQHSLLPSGQPTNFLSFFRDYFHLRDNQIGNISGVTTYNSTTMHGRHREFRSFTATNGLFLSSSIFYEPITQGPYKQVCADGFAFKMQIASTLTSILSHGCPLRVEIKSNEFPLDDIDIATYARFFIENDMIQIYDYGHRQSLQYQLFSELAELLTNEHTCLIKKICIEAYIIYILDGSTNRLLYDALLECLGATISNSYIDNFLTPSNLNNINHTSIDTIQGANNKLTKALSYRLRIDNSTANYYLQNIDQFCCCNQNQQVIHWIHFLLVSVQAAMFPTQNLSAVILPSFKRNFYVNQHQDRICGNRLLSEIQQTLTSKPLSQANQITFAQALYTSICSQFYPNMSKDLINDEICNLLRQHFNIEVWPHLIPLTSENRLNRVFVLVDNNISNIINQTIEFMVNNLSQLNWLQLPHITERDEETLTLFTLLYSYWQHNIDRLQVLLHQREYYCLAVCIMQTVFNRKTRRWLDERQIYIPWGQWRVVFGGATVDLLEEFTQIGILERTRPGQPSYTTMFSTHYLPNRPFIAIVHRLRDIVSTYEAQNDADEISIPDSDLEMATSTSSESDDDIPLINLVHRNDEDSEDVPLSRLRTK